MKARVANYTHFFAGRFNRETGPGKDIDMQVQPGAERPRDDLGVM